jgi:formate hydrogenlyase subunit 3/multisubunit Na+/H+ antiporter MnhD subunit
VNPCLALLAGAAAWALSGAPHALLGRRTRLAERLSATLAVGGSAVGCVGALLAVSGDPAGATASCGLPGLTLTVAADALSALFLLPVFLTSAMAAIYGTGYCRTFGPGARHIRIFQGSMTAGMVVLVLARNGVLFLIGWEVMAISAFLLIATDHRQAATRKAAWVYLATTHLCTLCLVAAMCLLHAPDGSLDWSPALADTMPAGRAIAVFTLALLGFGLKSGLMPLHVWLPGAHSNAPSHVSAVLSGVLIKMGAYGLLRILSLLPPLPAACGVTVLLLGATSALLGVTATFAQRDLKRLLAYSSIENSGIVFLGIGLAMLGQAFGDQRLYVLGLGGALFHVLNHSLFKPLLFLCAGSVVHATGTRELDQLGGLWRHLPRTGACFVVGAAAISGLPLLNGFASELVIYLGLFEAATGDDAMLALLGTTMLAAMAMVGGLAVAAFVRASGTVFLGRARSPAAAAAHESPPSMTLPLIALATMCLLIGTAPACVTPLLDRAIAAMPSRWSDTSIGSMVPFATLTTIGLTSLLGVTIVLSWLTARRRRSATSATIGTWACGFVDPAPARIQYTGTSFAQISGQVLHWTAKVHTRLVRPLGLFPRPRTFVHRPLEPALQGTIWPLLRWLADRCSHLRFLQRGRLHFYLLYVLIVLLTLLAWSAAAA